MRTFHPGTGTLPWGSGVGLRLLTPEISLLKFYPPHVDVGSAHSMDPPLPTPSLDACGFFNSRVARLPFYPISDGSEWWLFYSLDVVV